MRRSTLLRFVIAATLGALFAPAGHAQTASFRNFKRYPTSGLWQQELVGYRDGKAMGPPAVTKTCAGPLDAKTSAALIDAAKTNVANCTTRILTDRERLGEFETVCRMPAGVQTLRQTLRPIDDRTIASEVRSSMPGAPETLMKSKVTYLGPCTTEEAAASRKPGADECAAMAKMRQDNAAAGGAAQCAQYPAASRAQCEAQMAAGTKFMAAIEQQCK